MTTTPPCTSPLPSPFRRLPRRSAELEILDGDVPVSEAALTRSLEEMSRVNRRFGGTRSLLAHLRPLVRARNLSRLSLLDLGVGLGDVPRAIGLALGADGVRVRWTGIDLADEVLRLARRKAAPEGSPGPGRRGTPRLLKADARALPFATDSFDAVISTLTLHHLGESDVGAFLAEAARVAREGVFVSDLERHPLHYLGARLLAATLWRRDPVTRCDGPRSVLRAYHRNELRRICAGLPFFRWEVRRHPVFRVVVAGRVR